MTDGVRNNLNLEGTCIGLLLQRRSIPVPQVPRGDPSKPGVDVVAYLEKFSVSDRQQLYEIKNTFRGLEFDDAEVSRLLCGKSEVVAQALLVKGNDFERQLRSNGSHGSPQQLEILKTKVKQAYKLAAQLDPKNSEANKKAAWLLFREGKWEGSIKKVQKAWMYLIRSIRTDSIEGLLTTIAFLKNIDDPKIQNRDPWNFVGSQLVKSNRNEEAKSLYLKAASQADEKGARVFREKALWVDEEKYKLEFSDTHNPSLAKIHQALRREGVPSGALDVDGDKKISELEILTYINRNVADPRVATAIQAVGIQNLPWMAQRGKVPQEYLTPEFQKKSFTEKLAYHYARLAATAKNDTVRERELKLALDFEPSRADRMVALADCCLAQKKNSLAAGYYATALSISPQNADAMLGLARVNSTMGKFEDAARLFQQPGIQQRAPQEALQAFRQAFDLEWTRFQALMQGGHTASYAAATKSLFALAQGIQAISAADPRMRLEDLQRVRDFLNTRNNCIEVKYLDERNFQKIYLGPPEREMRELDTMNQNSRDQLYRDLQNTPQTAPWETRLNNARLVFEFDKSSTNFEQRSKDLETWSGLLAQATKGSIDDTAKLEQYTQIFKEWLRIKQETPRTPDRYLGESLNKSKAVDDKAWKVANRILDLQRARGRDANLYSLLNDIIRAGTPQQLQFLSAKGLDDYSRQCELAHKLETKAYAMQNPAQQRGLLLQALAAYAQVQNEGKAYELAKSLDAMLPAETGAADRLRLNMQIEQAVAPLQHGDSGIDVKIVLREKEDLLATQLLNQWAPGEGARVKDLLLVRAYLDKSQSKNPYLNQMTPAFLASERDRLDGLLNVDHGKVRGPALTPQQRVEDAGYVVLIDQAMLVTESTAAKDSDDLKASFGNQHLRHLAQLQDALDLNPGLPMNVRLEGLKQLAQTSVSYRDLTQGDVPLISAKDLQSQTEAVEKSAATILNAVMDCSEVDSLFKPYASKFAGQLRERCAADVKFLFHQALAKGDGGILSQFGTANLTQYVQGAMSAHALLIEAAKQSVPAAAPLQLQAGRLFAQLGLTDRVREAWQPLVGQSEQLADGGKKIQELMQWSALYQQVGMTEDANGLLGKISTMEAPGASREIHEAVQVAAAMKLLNEAKDDPGKKLQAQEILAKLPDNRMAVNLLNGINLERKHKREAKILGILQAQVEAKCSGDQKTASLAELKEVHHLLMSGRARNLEEAFKIAGAYTQFQNNRTKIGAFNIFWDKSSFSSHWEYFIHTASDPNLSDREFSEFLLGVARHCISTTAAENKDYVSASIVSQYLFDDPYAGQAAKELHDEVPEKAKSNARWAMLRNATIIFADSEKEAFKSAAMWLIPFGIGRLVGVAAELGWIAWATEGAEVAIELEAVSAVVAEGTAIGTEVATGLEVSSLVAEGAAAGTRLAPWMVKGVGFGIRVTSESTAITSANMALESVFNLSLDNWSWNCFSKQGLSMLVTMTLCHGIGAGMGALGKELEGVSWLKAGEGAIEELRQAGKLALNPLARGGFQVLNYSSRVLGFTGVGYLNEIVRLHQKSGDAFWDRLLDSAIMDAQMILSGKVIESATGGKITAMDKSSKARLEQYRVMTAPRELLLVVEGMGFNPKSPEGKLVLSVLMGEVAAGKSTSKIAERWGQGIEDYRAIVQDRLGLDPKGKEGNQMLALLLDYAHGSGRAKPGDPPLSAPELERIVEEMGLNAKSLVRNSGLAGPHAKAMEHSLLGMAFSRGMTPEALAKYAEAGLKYRDSLRSIAESVLGKGAEKTSDGQALMSEFLGRTLISALLHEDSPEEVARHLTDWQGLLSGVREPLQQIADALLGKGASQSPHGKAWLSQLLLFGISTTDSPEAFKNYLLTAAKQGPELEARLRSAVEDGFGEGAAETAQGSQRKAAMLFIAMNGASDPSQWGLQIERFSQSFMQLAFLAKLKDGKSRDALLGWIVKNGMDTNAVESLISSIHAKEVILQVDAQGEVKTMPGSQGTAKLEADAKSTPVLEETKLESFLRDRLGIDPTTEAGRKTLRDYAMALANGEPGATRLREFPEIERMVETQETAAKQVLDQAGMSKSALRDGWTREIVALALERGWTSEQVQHFAKVLARKSGLLTGAVDYLGGKGQTKLSDTPAGRQWMGTLLLDAMRASPDPDSFAATLMNMRRRMDAMAKRVPSLPTELLAWMATDHSDPESHRVAIEGFVEHILKTAGYDPSSPEYQQHRDFLISYFEDVRRGKGDQEGDWPRQAAELDALLRGGGTMTFLKQDGNHYELGPKPKPAETSAASQSGEKTSVSRPKAIRRDRTPANDDAATGREDIRGAAYADKVSHRPGTADSGAGTTDGGGPDTVTTSGEDSNSGTRAGGPKGKAAPRPARTGDAKPIALLVSADGMDTFDANLHTQSTVRLDSKAKKIPGQAWQVDITRSADGKIKIVPVKNQGRIGTNFFPSQISAQPWFLAEIWDGKKFVPIPPDGVVLREGSQIRLGDLEFGWKAPSERNARPLHLGSRQYDDVTLGEFTDYYSGPESRASIDATALQTGDAGKPARDFQVDLATFDRLQREYRDLESDYDKSPDLPKRQDLVGKHQELMSIHDKLVNSSYHKMEQNYRKALRQWEMEILPLETVLGLAESHQMKQVREGKRPALGFYFTTVATSPDKLQPYRDFWQQVPPDKMGHIEVHVQNWKEAEQLVKKLTIYSRSNDPKIPKLSIVAEKKDGDIRILKVQLSGKTYEIHFKLSPEMGAAEAATSEPARTTEEGREPREGEPVARDPTVASPQTPAEPPVAPPGITNGPLLPRFPGMPAGIEAILTPVFAVGSNIYRSIRTSLEGFLPGGRTSASKQTETDTAIPQAPRADVFIEPNGNPLSGSVMGPHRPGTQGYGVAPGYQGLQVLAVNIRAGTVTLSRPGSPERMEFKFDPQNPPDFVKGLQPGAKVDILNLGGGSAFPRGVNGNRGATTNVPRPLPLLPGSNVYRIGRDRVWTPDTLPTDTRGNPTEPIYATIQRGGDGGYYIEPGARDLGRLGNGVDVLEPDPINPQGKWVSVQNSYRLRPGQYYRVKNLQGDRVYEFREPIPRGSTQPEPQAERPSRFPRPSEGPSVAWSPFQASIGGTNTPKIDLNQVPPSVKAIRVYDGNPHEMSAESIPTIVIGDPARQGPPQLSGTLYLQDGGWKYEPVNPHNPGVFMPAGGRWEAMPLDGNGRVWIPNDGVILIGNVQFTIKNGILQPQLNLREPARPMLPGDTKIELQLPGEVHGAARGGTNDRADRPEPPSSSILSGTTDVSGNTPIPVQVVRATSNLGSFASATSQGVGYKQVNEDVAAWTRTADGRLVLTSIDGMGGMGQGDAAALLVAEAQQRELQRSGDVDQSWRVANLAVRRFNGVFNGLVNPEAQRLGIKPDPEEISEKVDADPQFAQFVADARTKAMAEARKVIENPSSEGPLDKGAGAVAVQAEIIPPQRPGDMPRLLFHWAGDARAMVLRRNESSGRWEWIYRTVDENLPNALGIKPGLQYVWNQRTGQTVGFDDGGEGRTLVAALHPQASVVTNAVGGSETMKVRSNRDGEIPDPSSPTGARLAGEEFDHGIALQRGYLIIKGSDGLWENFGSTKVILELIQNAKTAEEVTRILSDEAHQRMSILAQARTGKLSVSPGTDRFIVYREAGTMYVDPTTKQVRTKKVVYIDRKGAVYDSSKAKEPVDSWKQDNINLTAYLHDPIGP